jgi:aspartate/methionine/tyrosine aminotransferase
VVHPNNPTGHFTKPEEMRKLSELCATHGIAIIADEVFLDFALKQTPITTFAANSEALTFTMSGLSKICGLPQMKAAWLAVSGPEALRVDALARLEVIADTYLSMSAPIQWAMPALLGQRHSFQEQVIDRVSENLSELDRQLARQKSCSRLEVEGGWNAVIRVPATRSDEELALELLAADSVYIHPGHFYDFPSEGILVVSLITPENEFSSGLRQLLLKF